MSSRQRRTLAEVEFGIPEFDVEASVTFSRPRIPTVFERMVMRLIRASALRPQDSLAIALQTETLSSVFEDQLGAAGSPALLSSTVGRLLALGAITGTTRDPAKLILRPLAELKLTEAGSQFYLENSIPAQTSSRAIKLRYSPLTQGLNARPKGSARTEGPTLSISPETVLPQDLTPQVSEHIRQRTGEYIPADATLQSVTVKGQPTPHWITRLLEVSLNERMELAATCSNDEVTAKWLARLNPEIVYQSLIQPLFAGETWGARLGASAVWAAVSIRPLSGHATDAPDTRIVVFCDATSRPVVRIAVEEPDESSTRLSAKREAWPRELMSVTVTAGEITTVELIGEVPATWDSRRHLLPMLVSGPPTDESTAWLAKIAAKGLSSPSFATVAPALWGDSRSITAVLKGTGRTPDTLFASQVLERLQLVNSWKEAIPTVWLNQLAEAFEAKAVRASETGPTKRRLPAALVTEWLGLLKELPGLASGESSAAHLLLAVCQPVSTVDELESVTKASTGHELPVDVIDPALMARMIDEVYSGSTEIAAGPRFAERRDARAKHQELLRHMTLDNLRSSADGVLLWRGSLVHAIRALNEWRMASSLLEVASPALVGAGELTPTLKEFLGSTREWSALVDERLEPAEKFPGQVLIIDTNALLDEPGLLSQFSDEHQTVVIPLKVMEELDGLKENPRTTQKAQRAIKAIESARQQHPGWRIGESADTGLLPREIKPTKGDGQILATAIRFALADPVLITGDVNLRNRSEAMGIRSRGWREYMKEAQ